MSKNRPFDWRIGVGDPSGLRSQVWKVWAARNAPDIYITAPSMGGEMKVSIHASGDRHVGLTQEKRRNEVTAGTWTGTSRHYDQWRDGVTLGEGLTLEFTLRFPVSQLRKIPPSPKDAKALWVPAPPPLPNVALEIGVFVADRTMDVNLDPSTSQMGLATGQLADGRGVALISQVQERGHFDNMADFAENVASGAARAGITSHNVGPEHRVVAGFNVGHARGWAEYALDTFLSP